MAALEAELAQLRADRDALAQAVERARPCELALMASSTGIVFISGATGRHVFVNEASARLGAVTIGRIYAKLRLSATRLSLGG